MNTNNRIPEGTPCDTCQCDGIDTPATHRKLEEDTGFGKEYGYYCDACFEKRQNESCSGKCQWCKKESDDLRWVKDFDEGMSEPLYLVCSRCDKAQMEEIDRDLECSGYYDRYC